MSGKTKAQSNKNKNTKNPSETELSQQTRLEELKERVQSLGCEYAMKCEESSALLLEEQTLKEQFSICEKESEE